jgi:hypothetical protein
MYPERIANWRGVARPRTDRPLGMVTGTVKGPLPVIRIEAATLGCASCHAGTLYDEAGRPTGDAWLGLPNTSLNVDGYVWAVYRGLQRAARDPQALARRAAELFPEMGWRERFTLRRFILPRVRKRMTQLARTLDAPTPFSNGGAGRTNGVAALKLQLGLLDADRMHPEAGFTSIPELGSRQLRSSVLWDGTSVWVLLEGHRDDVVAQAAALGLRDADPPAELPGGGRWSLPPSRLGGLRGSGRFVAEIGIGVVHHELPSPHAEVDPAIVELHRRIKHQFDPAGRLNPGIDVLGTG